jgi:serine/threonine protein kinase
MGVTHRDLKPENIIVTEQGEVCIIDFNVSFHKDHSHATHMMTKTGTLAYSAPEIFTQAVYNNKVDVWSAGVVLHLMVSGVNPILGNNIPKLMEQIINFDADSLDDTLAHTSNCLRDLVKKMLNKDP